MKEKLKKIGKIGLWNDIEEEFMKTWDIAEENNTQRRKSSLYGSTVLLYLYCCIHSK